MTGAQSAEPDQRPRLRRILHSIRDTVRLAWRAARAQVLVVLGATVVSALVTPLLLLCTARFIDGVAARPDSVQDPRILYPLLGLGLLALVMRSITVVTDRSQVMFAERVHMSARFAFLRHLAGADVSLLEDPAWRDRLQRARADVGWRPYSMTQTLIHVFGSSITLASLLSALLYLDPMLLVLGLLSVLAPIVMRFRTNMRLYKMIWSTTRREREHDYLVNVAQQPEYANEVRAFDLGERIVERARALSLNRIEQQRGIYHQANMGDAIGGAISAVVLVVAYMMISDRALTGALSIGDVTAVLGAFASVTGHLSALLSALVSVDQHAPFLDDYFSFLATEPRVKAPDQPKALAQHLSRIELRGVGFSYPAGDARALDGVDLVLERGKTVALVGENGAGKSTLVKLLLRFFDVTEGAILVDGVDLRALDPHALRERVGVLFQDFVSYELEVREGLHFGRVHEPFDPARGARALEAARAHEVVASIDGGSRGLETVVGRVLEGGHELSGGQWQRLALARLIYRNADLWILDEPTANLDPQAEAKVFEELRALTADKMAIIISHRFSTVRIADEIVVLEQGRVKERGTHAALLAHKGRYAELFELQAKSYR
jgi:ATP-binding cassette, subfamily B, bacterial